MIFTNYQNKLHDQKNIMFISDLPLFFSGQMPASRHNMNALSTKELMMGVKNNFESVSYKLIDWLPDAVRPKAAVW